MFTGDKNHRGPYGEKINPRLGDESLRGIYATSKLEGEEVIKTVLSEDFAIVRIDFPFGNKNFPHKDYALKILSFIKTGGKLYNDQNITPTYIPDLIRAIKIIATNRLNGIFHVATQDLTTTTPYDFGKLILEKQGVLYQVESSKFPDSVLMPKFGGLDAKNTQEILGINFKSSNEAVGEFVYDLNF